MDFKSMSEQGLNGKYRLSRHIEALRGYRVPWCPEIMIASFIMVFFAV